MIPRPVSPAEFAIRENAAILSGLVAEWPEDRQADFFLTSAYRFAAMGARTCPEQAITAALDALMGSILGDRGGEEIEVPQEETPAYRAHHPWNCWSTWVLLSATLRLVRLHGVPVSPTTAECWRFALDQIKPKDGE